MKSLTLFCVALLFGTSMLFGQTYTMSTTGTVNTCSGNFYDSGGSGMTGAGRYANNENYTRTFCSSSGNCLRVTLSAVDIEYDWDFLYIHDGPTTASPIIAAVTGTTSPWVLTSSTGCLTFHFVSDGLGRAGGWQAAFSCVACPTALPSYTHPTTGIAGEYVGSCLVTDCGPFNYYDDGGATGNYSANINQIYRVFCPNTAGNCMRATFNSFITEDGFDGMFIRNGPTQLSPTLATITGYPAVPFTYTSTDASGCLTFAFLSDGSVNYPGFRATLQCVPCAGGPTGTSNSDCQMLTPLCSSASISGMANGPGIVAEGCSGTVCPAGGENHSNWYTFTAQTTGTLSVTVTPTVATDDYDIAIYGPNVTCGALGAPIRCSDAGTTGPTGAMPPGTGTSEDVTGDGYVSQLNVTAGQSYILVVDKWSPSGGTGYTLSFGGTASLDCTVLPIELAEFNAEYQPDRDMVDLVWITNSELNSSHFDVEKSTDGVNFRKIETVNAMGNSQYETQYYVVDEDPIVGVNYYRLNQFDMNGNSRYSEIRAVNILDDFYDMLSVFPNPTTGKTEVVFNSYSKEDVILNVVAASGTTVVNTPLSATNGGNRLEVDMSNQASGVYFVTVTTKDKVYKTKLIKE